MRTESVLVQDDTYERLKVEKLDGESLSDTLRRLLPWTWISDYHGALSEDGADELENAVERLWKRHEQLKEDLTWRWGESCDP